MGAHGGTWGHMGAHGGGKAHQVELPEGRGEAHGVHLLEGHLGAVEGGVHYGLDGGGELALLQAEELHLARGSKSIGGADDGRALVQPHHLSDAAC
eukprot:1189415-Prorocentrum_minimum.AAC.7